MIYVGLDDTDTIDSRGTNQLSKQLARTLAPRYRCVRIVRHQLLFDDRVPYTSKNGSASMWLDPLSSADLDGLIETLRGEMRREFILGSDPGLCVTADVPPEVIDFGRRCQSELVLAAEAQQVAKDAGLYLEGLGGTCDGVIGALAAVGLAATGDDGRVVQWSAMDEELTGVQPLAEIARRDVLVRSHDDVAVTEGTVDVGKKLRPNLRAGRQVLFVAPQSDSLNGCDWMAMKLT